MCCSKFAALEICREALFSVSLWRVVGGSTPVPIPTAVMSAGEVMDSVQWATGKARKAGCVGGVRVRF